MGCWAKRHMCFDWHSVAITNTNTHSDAHRTARMLVTVKLCSIFIKFRLWKFGQSATHLLVYYYFFRFVQQSGYVGLPWNGDISCLPYSFGPV